MNTVGKKDDSDKPMMQLLPLDVLMEVSKVLTVGAHHYGKDNWKIVPEAEDRYTGALLRHLAAWRNGEEKDSETGLSHLAHLACNAVFLVWHELHKEDDNGR